MICKNCCITPIHTSTYSTYFQLALEERRDKIYGRFIQCPSLRNNVLVRRTGHAYFLDSRRVASADAVFAEGLGAGADFGAAGRVRVGRYCHCLSHRWYIYTVKKIIHYNNNKYFNNY